MAKEFYEKALKKLNNSDNKKSVDLATSLKLNLCLILTGEKNYAEAIKLATEVLETDPNHVKALYRRANAYLEKDDLKGARDDLI